MNAIIRDTMKVSNAGQMKRQYGRQNSRCPELVLRL